jgi:uncharacterized delta-60 repeat protein
MKTIINIFLIIIFISMASYVFPQTQFYNPHGSVDTAWMRTYVSGLLAQDDEAYDIAVDDTGNTYVTGNIYNLQNGKDFCTIKYDRSGNQVWVRTYNGPGNSDDDARAIAIDKLNNIIVTGGSYDINGNSQFSTIKYNSAGEQLWVKHFSFLSTSGCYALDIALDNTGNIFVSGDVFNASYYSDIGTIKYNSSGDTVWTRRYNGPANQSDYCRKLTVDRSGNVYVIGSSTGSTTNYDYVTIKYNSAGAQQWAPRYNNSATNGDDRPLAVAVDSTGNVYVTGATATASGYPDIATVKYNSSGVQQWVAPYNGPVNMYDSPYDIGCDKSGNVFVTGYSYGTLYSGNIFTLKYNSAGVKQWSARVDSGSTYTAVAKALSIDTIGNIYITGWTSTLSAGYDVATLKYNNAGIEQWRVTYDGASKSDESSAIAVDNSGNVYVTGISEITTKDFLTIKYNQSGSQDWAVLYDGLGLSEDEAVDVATDDSGNIYVAGRSKSSTSDYDYLTIKYNDLGEIQWAVRYNGTDNDTDEPVAIAVDRWGNVLVTGKSDETGRSNDITTIKYNSSGDSIWTRHYNGSSNSYDEPFALTVDESGSIYITGQCNNISTYDDFITIKYDSSGDMQWDKAYSSIGGGDCGNAIALDDSCNVYVTGTSRTLTTSYDYTTIKYNSDGDSSWIRKYNGPANSQDSPTAIAVDENGNVFVTGCSYGVGSYTDYATVKYNRDGVEQWAKRYNGTGNQDDLSKGVVVDVSGNVYVTGQSRGSANFDYMTIKYNSAGDTVWTRRYNGSTNSDDMATGIMIDNLGYIYVTGKTYSTSTGYDFGTIKYNPAGVVEWMATNGSGGGNSDEPRAITLDKNENVVVTGSGSGTGLYYFVTVKYIQGPNAVEQTDETIPKDFALYQNYPNPFNPSTTIHFELPKETHVTLKVYNMLGQEMMTLVNENKDVGRYEVKFNASTLSSGVYYYRLVAGQFMETKKLILIR